MSEALENLQSAGFLCEDIAFDPLSGNNRPRTQRYRIQDNYLRFYLKYIEPVAEQVSKGLYKQAPLESLQAWDVICGLQFESLVLSNLDAVLDRIGLAHVPLKNAGPCFKVHTKHSLGYQIDLLLRSKQSLYVFEIKFRKQIQDTVIDEVKEKVRRLALSGDISVRTGLIYQGVLDSEIEASDYFDYILPFERLLKT